MKISFLYEILNFYFLLQLKRLQVFNFFLQNIIIKTTIKFYIIFELVKEFSPFLVDINLIYFCYLTIFAYLM